MSAHLEIGKAIHIGEMKAPPGVEILGDKHIPVLSVAAPVSEAQEAATLESATTPTGEVEMIKEKKEDGTEAKPSRARRLRTGQSWREGARQRRRTRQAGRQGCRGAAEKRRRQETGDKKNEELHSVSGEFVSHCGIGQSGSRIRRHPA